MMIRREPLEGVYCESYDWTPQWVYIHGMLRGMYSKQAANALVSVLGIPLHAELVDTTTHPQCLQACIQADLSFSFPRSPPYVVDERLRETIGELLLLYKSKAPKCIKCFKFEHRTNGCLSNGQFPLIGNSDRRQLQLQLPSSRQPCNRADHYRTNPSRSWKQNRQAGKES